MDSAHESADAVGAMALGHGGGKGPVALKREDVGVADIESTGEGVSSVANDRVINEQLQRHAAHADWKYADLAAELNAWLRRYNEAFLGGALPPAAVSIEPGRIDCLGWYLAEQRDGLGLRYRININALHVERSRALVLAVLLHEALHLWEEVVCKRRAVRGNYHTVRFQKKAAELGIPTCRNGIWGGITEGSPFAELLRRHGIAIDDELAARPGSQAEIPRLVTKGPGSRLAKWDCGCTKVWASSGVTVSASCDRCGGPFVRQPRGGK